MAKNDVFTLLQRLVNARGPAGQEEEVRLLCEQELAPLVDEMWVDPAHNLVCKIKGEKGGKGKKNAPSIQVLMHMDELSLTVKRVEEDGTLAIVPLGGFWPFSCGQGMVDILGEKEILPGVLSLGPAHVSKETPGPMKGVLVNGVLVNEGGNSQTLSWTDFYVVTRKSPKELAKLGVHPGTRVVIAQSRRQLQQVNDCIAGHFLDNRGAITIVITALKNMRKQKKKPQGDVYIVATTAEEIGGQGASYACRTLGCDISLALDIGPVAKEYQTTLSPAPIVVYKDRYSVYDMAVNHRLQKLGRSLKIDTQSAIFERYGSDSSIAKLYGQVARPALLCFPTENTHGYEVVHRDAFEQTAKLLAAYLENPVD